MTMKDLEYYNSFEERLQLELLKLCNSAGMLDTVLAEISQTNGMIMQPLIWRMP